MASSLARNTTVIATMTAVSRVSGLIREQVFFALFGAGRSGLSDAYLAAFRIPNLFRDLLAEGALSAAFVTTFSRTAETDGEERAWALANRLIAVVGLAVGALVIVGILAAPFLVSVVAPGFATDGDKVDVTVHLTRILWPFLLLVSLAALWMGMLNAHGRFAVPSAAPAMMNAGAVLCGVPLAVLFDRSLGAGALTGFALGALLGGALQWLVQVPALHKEGFRLRPRLDLRDEAVRRVLRLMAPAIIGVAAVQVNVTVNTRFASGMGDGAVAWLYGAFRLAQLPIGMFGVAAATAALPTLSRVAARGDLAAFRETLSRALRLVALLCIPSAVGLALVATPLIGLIYEHGRFGSADTVQTARALRFYVIGLAGYAGVKVLAPALYALGDARRPAAIALASIAVNLAVSWVFGIRLAWGHVGLAFSVSVVALLNMALLLSAVRHHVGPFGLAGVGTTVAKVLGASVAMAGTCNATVSAMARLMGESTGARLLAVVAAVAVAGITYWAAAYVLRVEEVSTLTSRVRARLASLAGPNGDGQG